MTLRENFDCISCNDCDMPYCDIKCTMLSDSELNILEQIADDYAIEFAYWLTDARNKNVKGSINIEKLLEIFKNEKGL